MVREDIKKLDKEEIIKDLRVMVSTKTFTMSNGSGAIIALADKMNEIIEAINNQHGPQH